MTIDNLKFRINSVRISQIRKKERRIESNEIQLKFERICTPNTLDIGMLIRKKFIV